MEQVYLRDELLKKTGQRTYSGDAREAAFLLGGIGTGNVSVGARGEFRDWEIFNSPGKGNRLPYSFFAIWAKPEEGQTVAKVLESRISPPYSRSHGFNSDEVAGLPRLLRSRMKGEYPFVSVEFEDDDLPVDVKLEAFTPFIPLNADDSGIPGAVIRYSVSNPSPVPVKVTVLGSLANAVGIDHWNLFGHLQMRSTGKNEFRDDGYVRGLFFTSPELPVDHPMNGSMALMTTDSGITAKPYWHQGDWWDCIHDLWDDFCADGMVEREPVSARTASDKRPKIGSLGIRHTLAPGETRAFEFLLAWHFPNRPRGWSQETCPCKCDSGSTIRNYYSRLWPDAWRVGEYLARDLDRLESSSRDFHRAMFGSSLPDYVIDAVSSNITVIRSTTCFRVEDGTFLGWEGCFDKAGCCEGSCTHVWNYAQTLAFLFPELEQTMRKVEFNLETDENGKMAFRSRRVFGQESWNAVPATDGQLGTIVRLYRDWKLSGGDDLLREVWGGASRALDVAFTYWDTDGDCVLDSQQHNTYDIEFVGPNSLTNSIFFAALKAGSEIAAYLGDESRAKKYSEALSKGSSAMDRMLWGGEYYIQQIDDVNSQRYQYGTGCLSDQLLGQLLAHVAGLGYILPEEHVRQAVSSVFRYNFRTDFYNHHNVQRTYALNDEKGLLLCSWPKGGRPKLPFVYSDEVWTGIEYQVAAHLIYEGYVEEGLTLVKAVRDRHDGHRRNPWNEVECGHHYARSTSSWAVLTALSGFECDMVRGRMSFRPRIQQDEFSTFWSCGQAWGIYRETMRKDGEREWEIEVLYGTLEGVDVNAD